MIYMLLNQHNLSRESSADILSNVQYETVAFVLR